MPPVPGHLQRGLAWLELEQSKPFTRFGHRDPAGLAEVFVIGLAAHGKLGIGAQLAIVSVIEVDFGRHTGK
jgi:hypothetical protein